MHLSDCSVYVLRHPHIPPSSSLILTNPSLFLLHPHTANGPLVKSIMCMLLAKQGYIMLWGLLLTSVDLKKKKTILVILLYHMQCLFWDCTCQTKFHYKSSQCLSCYQGWTRKADILLSSGYHIASLVYKAVDFVCDLKKITIAYYSIACKGPPRISSHADQTRIYILQHLMHTMWFLLSPQ